MLKALLYVDPGSGSYLVQMIIAAILGAVFYFKNFFRGVKSFFIRKKNDGTTKDELND